MTWAELVAPWPLFANVRSRVDDGFWVTVGMPGYIIGREQRDNDLMVTVTWADDSQTGYDERQTA